MATKKVGKFERENAIVESILNKEEITESDRMQLIAILQAPYHESGKIEGIQSIDSSAHNCTFCNQMRASKNPDLICHACYDYKLESFRENMKNRHGLQLKILSSVLFTGEELACLPIYTDKFRLDSCGDIENTTQARNYLRICKSHVRTTFTLWTKNLVAIRKALELENGKPENLIIIFSDPIINGCGKNDTIFKAFPWIDYIFMVARKDDVQSFLDMGMNECNGKKCKDCGYKCYIRNAWENHTVIVEKLR